MQNSNTQQQEPRQENQELILRFVYFILAIFTICFLSIVGLGWSNVQVVRVIEHKNTTTPDIHEIGAGISSLVILVLWIMPSIYAYLSSLLSLIKRNLKYLLIPFLFCSIWWLSDLGTNAILRLRSLNLSVVLPHTNIENLKGAIQQLSLGESCLIVFLGLLFNSYHVSSVLGDLSRNTLESLWKKINHWKQGGVTCQFEQLRIHDPIVRHYYNHGFPPLCSKGKENRNPDEKKIEDVRENVSEKLKKIRNLSDVDFKPAHKEFLRGIDLSNCNLTNADLSGMNLDCSILKGANLSYTNFTDASLEGSILAYTVVTGTKFQGAKLTGICIERWSLGTEHIMPEFDHQTICERVRFDEKSTKDFYPGEHEKFVEGEFEQLCQDTLNVVRVIIRNDRYVKVRILALRCVLSSNPNQQPRGYGEVGNDFYADIPNDNGSGVKVSQEYKSFVDEIFQVINSIKIDVKYNFETIYLDFSNLSSDLSKQLDSFEKKIIKRLGSLIHEVKGLNEKIHEIKLQSGSNSVQTLNISLPHIMNQSQLGSNSGDNSGNTVNAGNNAATNIGNNNQAQVQANVNQPIPQELTLDDVCRQLEDLISANHDIDAENRNLAKEYISKVRDLATNQETEKKSLLKTIINSLKGALVDAGNLYTECKKFIDALPSFFQ